MVQRHCRVFQGGSVPGEQLARRYTPGSSGSGARAPEGSPATWMAAEVRILSTPRQATWHTPKQAEKGTGGEEGCVWPEWTDAWQNASYVWVAVSLLTHLLCEGAGEGIRQARALVLGVRAQHVVVQGAAGAAGQRGQRAQPDLHGDDEGHRKV